MTGATTSRLRPFPAVLAFLAVLAAPPAAGHLAAQSLRGSSASLDAQNRVARQHDFSFLRTSTEVRKFVNSGYLVPVRPNGDFDLHAVSYPYARPQVALFVERLAAQYRTGCGEKLVVTSLTRPTARQPRNASTRSVHPTGMAIDLRRSSDRACREWLEDVLLELERAGVAEATRERYPPHYHVAVYPEPYVRYVETVADVDVQVRMAASNPPPATVERLVPYEVRRGDSLWTIARRYDTTVDRLQAENGLRSSRIFAGQVLEVPVTR